MGTSRPANAIKSNQSTSFQVLGKPSNEYSILATANDRLRMLHNLDMPSFVSDDSGHIASLQRPSEPLEELRQSYEKANCNTRPPHQKSGKETFENGLRHSLELGLDSPYGASSGLSGEMLNDSELSSMPNGRSGEPSWESKSSRNDNVLPANGATNGLIENGMKSSTSPNGQPKVSLDRNSVVSTNGGTVQPKHSAETFAKNNSNSENNGPPRRAAPQLPLPANPQSTGPLTYNTSLLPATPTPENTARNPTNSPHRFSSPPAYPAPNLTIPGGSTANPLQHPGTQQLKHRHTLQVPKPGPSRGSKDGEDGVFTSGRFSPTTTSGARRNSLSLIRRNTRSIHSDMPHEEVPQDEDAMRWAEAIRQKRASKRKRKDEEDDDRVVVGTKVDQNHVNWVTAYNMLTGIRFTVSRTNAKLDRPLTDLDFQQKHKFSFDITGNELTPSAKYDFKFKDYAPWVFRHLRARFKLDPADYLMSLTSKYILSELGSPGKSGSFFYFSRDYKYIIKTIHHAEHKLLRKILKDYYNHVEQNPNTLLSQFYGLHRVKIPYGRKIHFVVMNNLFPPHRDIHQTFDLKGSTIGRDFKEEDLEKNPRATLKDLNWLRRHLHLEFGPEKKAVFIEQMEKDVHLLQKLRIMDYSMLVGIHDLGKGNQENLRDKTLKVFQPGGETSDDDPLAVSHTMLTRTPSKLENFRKARELRQIIKQEKPIPMGQMLSKMPDSMDENTTKRDFTFYSDDGGFQATHDDNRPGEEIYYLGIIDLLTHYGTVKRLEHFWKGLSHDTMQISPIPSIPYGDRFIKFIFGITKTREEAEREANEKVAETAGIGSTETQGNKLDTQQTQKSNPDNPVIQRAENEATKSEKRGSGEDAIPNRTITTVRSPSAERTNDRAGMTLPIVDEVGESSSTGGKSAQDTDERGNEDEADKNYRPPTPPKDNGAIPGISPKKSMSVRNSSFDSNKALPAIPVASPEPLERETSVFA